MVEQRGFGSETGDLDLNLGPAIHKQWDLGQQCPTISSAGPHPTLVKVFHIVPVIDIHILFCSTIKSLLLSPQV